VAMGVELLLQKAEPLGYRSNVTAQIFGDDAEVPLDLVDGFAIHERKIG
jgi:hypothetical protein